MATNSSTQVIQALNATWRAIQKKNPDVPDVMIVTGRRRHKSEHTIRGQHCGDTWHVHEAEGRLAEVWVSGERLADGAREVLQTLLHEAAHALAGVRELKDTSNKNRYHNKVFVRLAEELGLEAPAQSGGPALGYSNCTIPDDTAKLYESAIERLENACKNFVAPSFDLEPETKRKPSRKAYCECPDDDGITWTKKLQDKLDAIGLPPILCGICRQAFVPEEEEDEEI